MAKQPVFNNGIFMKDVNMQITSDIDSYNLLNALGQWGDTKPTDLGVIDLFLYAKKFDAPLYAFGDFNKNTIEVDHPRGEFQWQLPKQAELPFIVEDIEPSNTEKGSGGEPFRLKFNKKFVSHGAVITYDKTAGAELIVTDDPIEDAGDGHVVYTVKLRNPDYVPYLDNVFLTPETKWFRGTSSYGEFAQKYDELMAEAGAQFMYQTVGNESAGFQYTISSRADMMMRGGLVAPGAAVVNSIFNIDYSRFERDDVRQAQSIDQIKTILGEDGFKQAQMEGAITKAFTTKLETAGIQKMIADNEYDMMWGKGAAVETEYGETLRQSVGLWQQLQNSYVHTYNIKSFRMSMFQSILENFFRGKLDIQGPDPDQEVVVQTGKGGFKLVMPQLKAEALGQEGLIVNATEVGAIRQAGSSPYSLTYGYGFTSYTIPFLTKVKFVYNPALDPIEASNIVNPIVDGYRLSSYSFIIFDITEGKSDNIVLLKKKWDNELRCWYENGKCDYLGRKVFQSSGGNFGYKVKMEYPKTALFIKDPTRVLKIIPNNPYTGRGFGMPY